MTTTVLHPFPLRIPEDTFQILRAEAAASGVSVNALIVKLIEEHLRVNRRELIDMIGQAANERYAVVLDKLADL